MAMAATKRSERRAARKTARKKARAQRRERRSERRSARRTPEPSAQHLTTPHLCLLRAPKVATPTQPKSRTITVATYNVHRWTGLNGRGPMDPARAAFVISEMDADVIALQEVMRPHRGEDPLVSIADAMGLHVAFAATRVHKRGEIGNAVLSRWPIAGVSMLDLSYSRMESRVAVAARFRFEIGALDIVATHLALADRTRHRQVRTLLDHPDLRSAPTLLLGDMNAWRKCKATQALDAEFDEHHNREWPPSFPSAAPVFSLDRVYSRGVRVLDVAAHMTRAAQRASDHLPVVARVRLPA
jgi:endonuclease/exonuclease/phosphatase family metal-dependent hydrolase